MPTYVTPGIYREEVTPAAPPELRTGVPAFLGYARCGPVAVARPLSSPIQFSALFGDPPEAGYLADTVAGFFGNGGRLCYGVRLRDGVDDLVALEEGLSALNDVAEVDLVAASDIVRPDARGDLDTRVRALQEALLENCTRVDERFALLDPLLGATTDAVIAQRAGLTSPNAALYYPWLAPAEGGGRRLVPPCGHVAGVYARTDERVGVYKAPANEALAGVLDVEVAVGDGENGRLNEVGVNCIRAFPGRGIRVWGARTLAGDPWRYVNVRRLFLTAARWAEVNLRAVAFEPNDASLWQRVERDLGAYFSDLFRRGALRGGTPEEAFFVRCDEETNPPEERDRGRIVAAVGLAPALPNEFVVVHIVHEASGVSIVGPLAPV